MLNVFAGSISHVACSVALLTMPLFSFSDGHQNGCAASNMNCDHGIYEQPVL